jgi:maleylpyruvate isomerase
MADHSPAPADAAQRQLDRLRGLLGTGTAHLLGGTISVSDEDWRGPSLLPGWSRGHLATHIARQADGLVRLADWARTGTRTDMYASPDQREDEIQAGALRSGLELQVDLDTSARQLEQAFAAVTDAGASCRPGRRLHPRRHRRADRGLAAGVVRLPLAGA